MIDAAAVNPAAYFSAAELDRAHDFRSLQRTIGFAEIGVSGGVLALLALRPPAAVRRLLDRGARRPLLGAAAAGAALSLVLVVATLPLDLWRHERAVDVGLSTQSLGPWFADVGRSAAIGAVLAGAGGAIAIGLVRRFPRHWWAPASGAIVALSVVFVYVAPVVLDPVFNRFDALPRGELRSQVLDLSKRAGVDVGEVYRVDASRRTTGANAYVNGLGHTKRVVLYDNLIEDYPRAELRSVVAHELAHVKYDDVLRGLAWLAFVAPAGAWLVQLLAERIARRGREGAENPFEGAGPAVLPAIALAVALVSFGVGLAGNGLSRRMEARADAFALKLTNDPKAFVDLEQRLAVTNVSEPDPPEVLHTLFGTHPTTVERIGFGVEYGRGREPARGGRNGR